jgi:hypothetical protein
MIERMRTWMFDFASGGGPSLGSVLAIAIGGSIVLGLIWLWIVLRLLRRATIDRDPETLAAVRALPLGLALGLDALDLGLDFFGAPIAWLAVTEAAKRLDLPELKRLRSLTVIESLIPGTQLIPVMTITWLYAQNVGSGEGALPGEGWANRDYLDAQGRIVDPPPRELSDLGGADADWDDRDL